MVKYITNCRAIDRKNYRRKKTTMRLAGLDNNRTQFRYVGT